MLTIDGVQVQSPKVFQVDIHDLDADANRNTKGELVRDRIAVKRKLICEWPPLDDTEISIILNAVKKVFFTVTYPDPMEGSLQTKTFYVGDRSAPMYWKNNEGKSFWKGLKLDLIEK